MTHNNPTKTTMACTPNFTPCVVFRLNFTSPPGRLVLDSPLRLRRLIDRKEPPAMNGSFLSLVKAVTSCCIFTSVLLRTQDSAGIVLGSSWLCGPNTPSCACLHRKAHDPIVCVLGIGDRQCLAVSLLILLESLAKTLPLNWLRTLTLLNAAMVNCWAGSRTTMASTLPPRLRFGDF